MRGNHCHQCLRAVYGGPIPACAGQPISVPLYKCDITAYPRVCGAAFRRLRFPSPNSGLSPRVRGSQPKIAICVITCGPIPACAGQPEHFRIQPLSTGAYPRVCGAASVSDPLAVFVQGLSPRVRGSRVMPSKAIRTLRPIPACAGQPARLTERPRASRAYPRVCGATYRRLLQCLRLRGLSPRVRGNPAFRRLMTFSKGPIPACAGQPHNFYTSHFGARAYPRVCGATLGLGLFMGLFQGLSPRVRGNRAFLAPLHVCEGPIPACAGQPTAICSANRVWRAYPRVCGATSAADSRHCTTPGLSPRVRGNR